MTSTAPGTDGTLVVVTGAASGIGQGVAERLCQRGCLVAGIDIADQAATAEACGDAFTAFPGDVAQPDALRRAFLEIDNTYYQPLYGLVAVAGVSSKVPFLDTSAEEFDRVIGVNLRGVFFCCQEAGRRMAATGRGRIVTISSTASIQAWPHQSAYGASKGGVATLTKCIAADLAPFGVLVNAVAPGSVETPMAKDARDDDTSYEHDILRTPLRRWGKPSEIAAAVAFLLFDAAWMTGQQVIVDGGFITCGAPIFTDHSSDRE